jgi:hypothetical protein
MAIILLGIGLPDLHKYSFMDLNTAPKSSLLLSGVIYITPKTQLVGFDD